MKVGVLALQGDFREHIKAATECGHLAIEVRRASELSEIDALILPGGESTTIIHLAQSFDLYEPIKEVIAKGLPVYGSCAGMILLADRIVSAIQSIVPLPSGTVRPVTREAHVGQDRPDVSVVENRVVRPRGLNREQARKQQGQSSESHQHSSSIGSSEFGLARV